MTKFKVGDRVRLKRVNTYERWGAKGEEGTVIVADDGADDCRVNFDVAGKWYASWDDLEVVSSEATVAAAPAAATLTVEAGTLELAPTVGSSVLIPGWITSINHSPKGTVYGIAFETKSRRVSLHFTEEDFIPVDEGDCPCSAGNDNGPLPSADTSKAFDALGDWLRSLAVNPSAAFRSNKETA